MKLLAASGTHPGQLRENNQDAILAYIRPSDLGPALGLFIVADGMGGHKAGEIASNLTIETIKQNLDWMLNQDDLGATVLTQSSNSPSSETSTSSHLEIRLKLAVQDANRVIYEYAHENPEKAGNLGSTVTCAIVNGSSAVIANVGDSRTYRWRDGQLKQITADHSYVWQLVSEGYINSDEVFDHPQRNVITRALGNQESVQVDLWQCDLKIGDKLLLCSDGMWEMIRDPDEIAAALEIGSLETVVEKLIEASNGYGGYDNIGVVVVELGSDD